MALRHKAEDEGARAGDADLGGLSELVGLSNGIKQAGHLIGNVLFRRARGMSRLTCAVRHNKQPTFEAPSFPGSARRLRTKNAQPYYKPAAARRREPRASGQRRSTSKLSYNQVAPQLRPIRLL